MNFLALERVARRFHPDGEARGDSYTLPFTPGESLCHVAALRDRGDVFLGEDGKWRGSTAMVLDKSGHMGLPVVPAGARHCKYLTWRFLIFPKRMSKNVSDALRSVGTFLEVRDGTPTISWTGGVDQGNECLPGTCSAWTYKECSPGPLSWKHHAPDLWESEED